MRFRLLLPILSVCFLSLLLVLSIFSIPLVFSDTQPSHTPRIRGAKNDTSLNWGAYAVTASPGTVTDSKGSWKVPAVTCSTGEYSYSSFWVGIDGYSSNTVEQTGTDSDCRSGTPRYYAWFEFYPQPAFIINTITVHPGDVISAEVKYIAGKFAVTITDVTTRQTFSTTKAVGSAARSSAECIAEAPSSGGGILPLANFGTAYYGQVNTGVLSTCYATINGVTGSFGSFGSNVQQITMVAYDGSVKAQPSALSTDGTSFSVTWKSKGP